jgi:hypothetical protein
VRAPSHVYLPEYDLKVSDHAFAHWSARCGLAPYPEAVAEAVAGARPATRGEENKVALWLVRHQGFDRRVGISPRHGEDRALLVNEARDVALLVVLAAVPVVVTVVPLAAAVADVCARRRAAKRQKRARRRYRKIADTPSTWRGES